MDHGHGAPALVARLSPGSRRASMVRFERLCTRVLMVGSAAAAVAMATLICTTAHRIG